MTTFLDMDIEALREYVQLPEIKIADIGTISREVVLLATHHYGGPFTKIHMEAPFIKLNNYFVGLFVEILSASPGLEELVFEAKQLIVHHPDSVLSLLKAMPQTLTKLCIPRCLVTPEIEKQVKNFLSESLSQIDASQVQIRAKTESW
eukprot:CAMPEP_0115002006 /NCGR_PEP_ID=MMETSP0216-20121206/17748_1 /TAXON_ID=223996 /ORGANISM="Protocruzia adherens, Strain Boccale" /LENGTH=147 /DNA_ID=CAMNT_0002367517 /DNA_START=447 /DNA_END=887 /DNA_ORIENTATION=+